MNPIDIRDLALNLSDLIAGLDSHRARGPILVTRDGQPEAVIIRHKAWAPRLHDFAHVPGGIVCRHCDPPQHITCDTSSLAVTHDTANQHWRDTHQEKTSGTRTPPYDKPTPPTPVADSWEAGERLTDLYGCPRIRANQIRDNRTVLGWRASNGNGLFYVLKDGRHGGPFPTVDAAETHAKNQHQEE